MSSANVVQIDNFREGTGFTTGSGSRRSILHGDHRVVVEERNLSRASTATRLSHIELYPFTEDNDSVLSQAINLLSEADKYLSEALGIDPINDFVGFDEKLMRVRAALRKLFELRYLGDGFGAVINGCLWSLKNKETETLSRRQTTLLRDTLAELKRKPLMHFDTAMSLLDELEVAELSPEPEILDDLFGTPEDNE